MGESAEEILNGEVCQMCGTYIEQGDVVYALGLEMIVSSDDDTFGIGCPVTCAECS